MNHLIDLITLQALIDGVITFTLIEGTLLTARHALTCKGLAPRDFALNMVSGLCLMLALRCVVHDSAASWVAGWLLAAGMAHGTDILLRSRGKFSAELPS